MKIIKQMIKKIFWLKYLYNLKNKMVKLILYNKVKNKNKFNKDQDKEN